MIQQTIPVRRALSRGTARAEPAGSYRKKCRRLRLSPTAWAKLLYLRDAGDSEVGGFGISAARTCWTSKMSNWSARPATSPRWPSTIRPWRTILTGRWMPAQGMPGGKDLGPHPSGVLPAAKRHG